ncbi:MFAP1 domain-containing protein [Aphelenchoides besseyi]|nr:MFAP1 domain-containing protein [Aphelenchoides besseyi]
MLNEVVDRRELLKQRKRKQEEELLAREEESSEEEEQSTDEEDEESEEEESDSWEEATPLLKSVFVQTRDRITLVDAEEEEKRLEQLKIDEDKRKEERKKESIRIMEEQLKREDEMKKQKKQNTADIEVVNTDDEDDEYAEVAYELWQIREMERLKRTCDEREVLIREKAEIDNVHNMTEEERKEYMRLNPRIITNKVQKGKYKFLQKYYHRGVFYLNEEDEVLKRNYAEATGEDEFDKSLLPKVMQVKNFGKASRTKHTHLTAEDTTDHQGVWATKTPVSTKFLSKRVGGVKNVFERPAAKKRKINLWLFLSSKSAHGRSPGFALLRAVEAERRCAQVHERSLANMSTQ